jgi:hypothetical protein
MAPITFIAPNMWVLSGGGIHVRYSTTSLAGTPQFHYQDSLRVLNFTGAQIRSVSVPDVGTLVSVTIHMTVDTGSTTFTIVLPQVNLVAGDPASGNVTTFGITTTHAFSIVAPFDIGQREFYGVTTLTGTASLVVF